MKTKALPIELPRIDAVKMGTVTIGKSQVRYWRKPDWPVGVCWVYFVNGQDEGKHIYIGRIERSENPRRYNGKKLKADAALHFLAWHMRRNSS